MVEKEITCIICPLGCKILVRFDKSQFEILKGGKCRQGIEYARYEALDPRRVLTSSVLVVNGKWPLVSVKTTKPVPKNKIFSVIKEIKKAKKKAPIDIGQIIIKNVAKTGVDVVATKTVKSL